jgi:hypothetical protein
MLTLIVLVPIKGEPDGSGFKSTGTAGGNLKMKITPDQAKVMAEASMAHLIRANFLRTLLYKSGYMIAPKGWFAVYEKKYTSSPEYKRKMAEQQQPKAEKKSAVVPFGKYRGMKLADIPDSYLDWLRRLNNLYPWLRRAVDDEYELRMQPQDAVMASIEALPRR